ncbi:MAG: YidC/Oxa1 family membrane protein insertase [Candidatus Pacebacteria bacterium]|nr:YidC/Oxa1 family membrane protein insertase [Candidatus Paceibacterota bacterium]
MISFFYTTIYQPLFNLMVFIYNIVPYADLGVVVILLTVLIKILLFPLGVKATKSQKEMNEIQPEIKKIQKKYKDDKEEQAKKILEIYKEKKINPFSGIFVLLIQLPILISLFQIFRKGVGEEEMSQLYSFVSNPGVIDTTFLNIIDISSPNTFLAILAAGGQYYQMKISTQTVEDKGKKSDTAKMIQKQMLYFLPVFTFIILLTIPSAVGLYWIVTVLFSVLQFYLVKNKK